MDQHITEVRGADGSVVGYAVDAETRAALKLLQQQVQFISVQDRGAIAGGVSTQGITDVAGCIVGLSAFAAMTVFPQARLAKLAVRVGKMINKYGVKKVAQILTRTYKGTDNAATKMGQELMKELSGVAALAACGL